MAGVREVAQKAGVSTATVSRVLSGASGVSAARIKKVRAAAAALNYRPETAKRGKPSTTRSASQTTLPKQPRKSHLQKEHLMLYVPQSKAVALHDQSIGYFAYVFSGMMRKAQELGCALNLRPYPEPAFSELLDPSHCANLRSQGAQGLLFLFTNAKDQQLLRSFNQALPWIALNRNIQNASLIVRTDERRGAREATAFLLQKGHRKIGVLAGPKRLPFFEERLTGIREELKHAGVNLPATFVVRSELQQNKAREAARTLLSLKKRPSALFATEEDFAAAIAEEAERMGIRIPEDLSLLAFSDFVLSEKQGRALTAVSTPSFEMGYLAVEALWNANRFPYGIKINTVLQPKLIVRDSIIEIKVKS